MIEFVEKAGEMIRRLSNVRGAAHDAIISEWIRCWLELDPENHLVFNPAPKASGRVADIMFLKPEYDKEVEDSVVWIPSGVAEIENNRKKWFEKLESLNEYTEVYPIKFVLLCVRVYVKSKVDMEAFERLVEEIRELSRDKPNVSWILYRLNESPYGKDVFGVVFDVDPEAAVWYHRFISSGEAIIFKDGKIEQIIKHSM